MLRSFESGFAKAADRAACRKMIRSGSKSFSAAALLLPWAIRDPAYALYAFCRLSDDLVDVEGGTLEAIAQLRERLKLAYEGRPADSSIDRAFADVVARFAIPRALPEALIEGLERDVVGVACENLSDVCAYASCVAGAVGAMMAVLMGTRAPQAIARACDLGVAMQLTNIARDVGEDARSGRLYLPRAWLRDEGLDPDAWLAAPVWRPEIATVIARLLREADHLYTRAETGIRCLPASCRPGIFAARHLYQAIGIQIARNRFDSVTQRARVPGPTKFWLIGRALANAATVHTFAHEEPPLAETRYLVDAVTASQPCPARGRRRRAADRVLWVAELFAMLNARDSVPGRVLGYESDSGAVK
jgi:phytoene synthase